MYFWKEQGKKMKDNRRYFVVTEKAVPDVLLKVVEAKRLLDIQQYDTVQEAVAVSYTHLTLPTNSRV